MAPKLVPVEQPSSDYPIFTTHYADDDDFAFFQYSGGKDHVEKSLPASPRLTWATSATKSSPVFTPSRPAGCKRPSAKPHLPQYNWPSISSAKIPDTAPANSPITNLPPTTTNAPNTNYTLPTTTYIPPTTMKPIKRVLPPPKDTTTASTKGRRCLPHVHAIFTKSFSFNASKSGGIVAASSHKEKFVDVEYLGRPSAFSTKSRSLKHAFHDVVDAIAITPQEFESPQITDVGGRQHCGGYPVEMPTCRFKSSSLKKVAALPTNYSCKACPPLQSLQRSHTSFALQYGHQQRVHPPELARKTFLPYRTNLLGC